MVRLRRRVLFLLFAAEVAGISVSFRDQHVANVFSALKEVNVIVTNNSKWNIMEFN